MTNQQIGFGCTQEEDRAMARFLTTTATSACIEQIILSANKRVVLLSPYLKWSDRLYERLQDADRRDIEIIVVYGKTELTAEQADKIESLRNVKCYFKKDLHAKCYFNEARMIISSMNLHEYSEKNNYEMSVEVESDDPVYEDAKREADVIIQAATLQASGERRARARSFSIWNEGSASRKDRGHCIRCQESIPLNPARPLCDSCYSTWDEHRNPDYPEKFCHRCGRPDRGRNYQRPRCDACYRDGL